MEEWQCFEQKIVALGEQLIATLLDTNVSIRELRDETRAVKVEISRIASILEAEHRPQRVSWHVGTPTQEE